MQIQLKIILASFFTIFIIIKSKQDEDTYIKSVANEIKNVENGIRKKVGRFCPSHMR